MNMVYHRRSEEIKEQNMDFKTEYRYGEMLYKRFMKMNRKREKKGSLRLRRMSLRKQCVGNTEFYQKRK